MQRILFLMVVISFTASAQKIKSPFELSDGNETGTYDQVISFYKSLSQQFPEDCRLLEMGPTDSGINLHMLVIDPSRSFEFTASEKREKTVILINNGIHPGEPDGIEASMMLARDILENTIRLNQGIILCIIPVYNIGGALNRNSTSRVNQNGPEAYGFRGNARNYDLNRDFIKADTRNARSFHKIFQMVNPDILIDTHVSNGADYQYQITHLATQHNRIGGNMGKYIHDQFTPRLEEMMKESGNMITPYVNVFNRTPDEKGFSQFMDSPRYSTGYATLFGTLGFMIETHMLKPFDVRVKATYEFLSSVLKIAASDGEQIRRLRKERLDEVLPGKLHPIDWKLDETKSRTIGFAGYEGAMQPSEVTGLARLKYDRNKPFERDIPYFDTFVPSKQVIVPAAYIIPRGWHEVIDRLIDNNVNYQRIEKDTSIAVEYYVIESVTSSSSPYEGHFPHRNMVLSKKDKRVTFHEGDYIFPIPQPAGRFLVETLEPEATDSYFRWNFFDTILQQKEGFSPYVFEDLAVEILRDNPGLRDNFNAKKASDSTFASNWYAQLNYIYENSEYKEKAYLKYPVYRMLK